MNPFCITIQIKAIEQYFHVVLCFQLSFRCLKMWSNAVFRIWYITYPTGSSLVRTTTDILRKSSCSLHPMGVVLKVCDNFTSSVFSCNKLMASGKFFSGSMLGPIDMWTSFQSKSSQRRSIVTDELSQKRRALGLATVTFTDDAPGAPRRYALHRLLLLQ